MATEPELRSQYAKRWGRIVARAWVDEAFKERLLAEPKAVLWEYGIPVPASRGVRVLELPEQAAYFVLPPRPRGELTDEQLDRIVGAGELYCIVGDPGC